jgi:hypothetical protein
MSQEQTATEAVRIAKLLHTYGCEVIEISPARKTSSCYVVAAIYRRQFRVRLSDHPANPRTKQRKIPTYKIRVDRPGTGTAMSLSRWISEKVLGV